MIDYNLTSRKMTYMIVHPEIGVHQYDSSRWVVSTPTGRHFIVSNKTRELIDVLRASSSWDEAYASMKRQGEISISQQDFIDATCQILENRGVLMGETVMGEPVHGTYLRYRVALLSPTVCRYMSMILPSVMYKRKVFWSSLLVLSVVASAAVYAGMSAGVTMMGAVSYPGLLCLLMGAMFIHELGHIAACRSQNLEHGPIGAGIYFFIPVLYADISRVWQLPRERRLMANMGGIHAELCYLGVVFLTGSLISSATLIYASMIGGASVIYQLNPFARRDGYWVLSDAAGVPNLLRKAQAAVKGWPAWTMALWRNERAAWGKLKSPMFWFLSLYGVGNVVVIGIFAMVLILTEGMNLLLFPQHLVESIRAVIDGSFTWSRIRGVDFLALMMYTLIGRLLYAAGRQVVMRIRRRPVQKTS